MWSNILTHTSFNIYIYTGIAPDSKPALDHQQRENMEHDQKMVRKALVSAYDKNISTRLKAELCGAGLEVNNVYNTYIKEAASASN